MLVCTCTNKGFPGGHSGEESTCQRMRLRFDPWVKKIPWSRKWQPTPVSLAWRFHRQNSLADCSPQIPRAEEPGSLQSTGPQRGGHDWVRTHKEAVQWWKRKEKSACPFRGHSRYGLDPWVRKTPTNRKWQPIPVFFPGKFHGQRSLVGYKESDTTRTHTYLCKKQSFLPKWIKINFSNWLF